MRLIEISSNKQPIGSKDDLSQMFKNCSAALASNVVLYRGINLNQELKMFNDAGEDREAFLGTIRTDRKARDSDAYEVGLFDLFMEICGLPFKKSNTLSVTNSRKQAAAYGLDIFHIYPFDSSLYLYSRYFSDLMSITDLINQDFWDNRHTSESNPILGSDDYYKEMTEFISPKIELIKKELGLLLLQT